MGSGRAMGICRIEQPVCHAQTMVRHKSRLEREKEAAVAKKDGGPLGSAGQARQRRSPAGSSFAGQVCLEITCAYLPPPHFWYSCSSQEGGWLQGSAGTGGAL